MFFYFSCVDFILGFNLKSAGVIAVVSEEQWLRLYQKGGLIKTKKFFIIDSKRNSTE